LCEIAFTEDGVIELQIRLHAFGGDDHEQFVSEPDDGAHHDAGILVARCVCYERTIDLHFGERRPVQFRYRRQSGPVVVEREPDTRGSQPRRESVRP